MGRYSLWTALLSGSSAVLVPAKYFNSEDFQEAPFSQLGDDHGAAVLHPLGPTEIEAALGERGSYRARDMWPSFGPVQTQPAQMATSLTQGGKVDPEFGEKPGACRGDFSGFVADHDVVVCD